jgi:hypothetical protein
MRICRRKAFLAFSKVFSSVHSQGFMLLALALLPCSVPAQAQSQPASPAASQAPAQPQGSSQTQSKKAGQSVKTQENPANKQTSVADVARKANADNPKPKPKRVFTNDDLSGLGGGISVVGSGPSDHGSAVNEDSTTGSQARGGASTTGNAEASWRARARAIKDQIAAVDQQIDKVKQEIAKSGPASFDPTTGLTQNVIVLHDRNAELQRYQDQKQRLEKQLDDLTDEGRKAGADPGWFR